MRFNHTAEAELWSKKVILLKTKLKAEWWIDLPKKYIYNIKNLGGKIVCSCSAPLPFTKPKKKKIFTPIANAINNLWMQMS